MRVRHERTGGKLDVRCCTRDEGRPLGAGVQAQAPTPLKLQVLRASVVSVEEKAGQRSGQVKRTETSVSEPLKTCRKCLRDVETRGNLVTLGAVWGRPVYCPRGVRHGGGVTVRWALVRNVGTCRSDGKGEPQVGNPHKRESTEAGHRDGGVRSREEGPVMGPDRRDAIVQGHPVANRQREEPRG